MTLWIPAPRFHLRHTLESGQFFRWTRAGDAYFVQRGLRFFRVRQQGAVLEFSGADPWFVREFFALGHDSAAIEEALRRDRRLRPAVDAYSGLRILRQDPWECAVAFLLSIASNIPRITGNVSALAAQWGRRVRLGSRAARAFPRPEELGGEAELRDLRLGFRARYLVHAARLAQAGLLSEVAHLPGEEAREALMVIPGVAGKVADCILLFAYGRLGAFPIDTWIRRVMRELYFGGRRVPDRVIRDFAEERWGDLAGYAQQYLYMWSREKKIGIKARRAAASPV